MRGERAGHTLQATALVHEAWMRFAGSGHSPSERGAFYCAAATAMRRVLINHARDRGCLKRGGGARRLSLDASHIEEEGTNVVDLLALEDALQRLAQQDRRKERLVELRYFAGLDNAAAAATLGISLATVKREWIAARAWLRHFLDGESQQTSG